MVEQQARTIAIIRVFKRVPPVRSVGRLKAATIPSLTPSNGCVNFPYGCLPRAAVKGSTVTRHSFSERTSSMRKLLFWAQIALVGSAAAADLPIREVILYKHGVGYFERAGELRAGETARLDFKASDMNDVLKSLTVSDRNGGVIGGIRYDAAEPLEKRLQDFPFALDRQASLAAFLDQMKGARLELRLGSDT